MLQRLVEAVAMTWQGTRGCTFLQFRTIGTIRFRALCVLPQTEGHEKISILTSTALLQTRHCFCACQLVLPVFSSTFKFQPVLEKPDGAFSEVFATCQYYKSIFVWHALQHLSCQNFPHYDEFLALLWVLRHKISLQQQSFFLFWALWYKLWEILRHLANHLWLWLR